MRDPIESAVDDMLDFLLRMARTYHDCMAHGLRPMGLRECWPFETTDDYGDYDEDGLTTGGRLVRRVRVHRPRPEPYEIDQADKVFRAAIRCLKRDQLYAIMIEGGEKRSGREKARMMKYARYDDLKRFQRAAAQDVVNFLLEAPKDWTRITLPHSVLASSQRQARDIDKVFASCAR